MADTENSQGHIRTACSHCQADLEIPVPESGQEVYCPACGTRLVDLEATVLDETGPAARRALQPGQELGGFLIEERIGMGAMGVVYKATQVSLDRTVALKVLPPAFAERPALVKRFNEESTALSTLNHPNVVTIIDRGNVGNIYFFVMEHVDGPSLQDVMAGPCEPEMFLKIAKGAAAALDYAHRQGIVHRDIKPSNIMINSQGQVKIADFGLAGIMTHHEEQTTGARPTRMGTPAYMSPEQKEDPLSVDGRTDIYSTGVVFYEMLIGEKPELPLKRLPSQLSQAVDPRLDPIVARALETDPADRYENGAEMLEDLLRFEAETKKAPVCPDCGKVSPVRSETCVECGRSLEEFFDICPECRQRNRRDVRHCLQCGADLEKGRTLISNKVAMMLDQADSLRLAADFDEALEILEDIQTIEGRAFQEQRERAVALRERTAEERLEAARRAYREGRKMLRAQRFREAIEQFRAVPPDVKDTAPAIRAARLMQARLAAEKRARATTNLILIVLSLIALLVLVLGVVLAR